MDEGLSSTGRRMCGWALKWGEPAFIRDDDDGRFQERFRRGAFAESIAEGRVLLCLDHDISQIVARQANGSLTLVEDAVGLRVEALALDCMAGDDAISAVRCRDRAGLSVAFKSPTSEWAGVDGVRRREVVRCELREISVVRNPAYRSSTIVAGAMRIGKFMAEVEALDHTARLARLAAAEAAVARR
jgi:HK97 family phage prohead protease